MDFASLPDKTLEKVHPSLLLDFSMGNKRSSRPEKSRSEMRESIRSHGVLQNLITRPHPTKKGHLELLGGYGRRDLALELELSEVPVLVKQVDDREAYIIHLQENTIRSDLSIVDEGRAAQEFNSLYGGDRQSVSDALNWPLKKVNERLELMKCTDKVLDALSREKITVGHAMAIAPFSHQGQDKLIDVVLAQGWSAKELKLQIGAKQTPLSIAKFDKGECNSCPHNTFHQMGLLDDVSTEAKCAKITCFREKTAEWLAGIRKQAEERFGKVLYLSESAQKDRSTVNADVVGEQQYKDGCTPCEKRIVVMSDVTGKEGELTENQCIDKVCFAKCQQSLSKAESAAMASANVQEVAKTDPAKAKSMAKSQAKSSAQKSESGTIGNMAQEHHKALLRQASASHFEKNNLLKSAFMLAALVDSTGYSGKEKSLTGGFGSVVQYAYKNLSMQTMQEEMLAAISHGMTEKDMLSGSNATNLMIELLKSEPEHAKSVAVKAWEPNEANLKIFTTQQIIEVAKDANVPATMNAKEEGAFNKATKGKKADLIKTLVELDHDYSEFAPSWYLTHVTQ
ncbi:ParB/RepB/Spo0J family partition protein [Salinimonas chungwhensis]|uniref:ParB/RepB/Spo0J family partition protein n=1 Tax=Salinimonas chungwhensis TaxID=265425 RepID=UPI00037AD4F9|nr:ParB/RepB/Spo0J family partition protein [Salinimonas chungwhensis]